MLEATEGLTVKTITGWLLCRAGTRDEFLTLMEPLAAATRQEAGCRLFEYHRADRNADEIILIEVFDSAEAHELHRRTPHMFEMQSIVRRLLGRIRLLEVISATVLLGAAGQALGAHGVSRWSMALAVIRSLRMAATMASLAGLPWALRCR